MTPARWLLLHGTPLSPQVWDDVAARLDRPPVVPDLNQLIRSAASGNLQTQVAAAVLANMIDDRIVVVGHSFGGQIAIEIALLAPRRVAQLVVVCSRHTPFPAFAAGAQAVREGRPADIEAGLRRWFTRDELAADGAAVHYVRRRLQTARREPWAASLDAIADYDRSKEVAAIAAPVSLFAAGLDEVSPPSVMAELAAGIPHAELEVVEQWAHMSPFAQPTAFAGLLTAAVEPRLTEPG
jgi:pimeloyl-ACP methyl ester carboxylesterase